MFDGINTAENDIDIIVLSTQESSHTDKLFHEFGETCMSNYKKKKSMQLVQIK